MKLDPNVNVLQGVPKKTPSCLWRLITLVWKQLLGQVGTVLEFSGYELSFETKKSRSPGSLRKMRLKLATLSQNLTLLYHRYSPLRMSCSVCVKTKSQRLEPNLTGVDTIISLATSHRQALTIHHLKTRILSTAWHYWEQVLFPSGAGVCWSVNSWLILSCGFQLFDNN